MDHLTTSTTTEANCQNLRASSLAAIVAPKHRSSWNADRAWHETYFLPLTSSSSSMILSHDPASLQIPPEQLFGLNLSTLVTTCLPSVEAFTPSGFMEPPFTPLRGAVDSGFSASPSGSRLRTSFSFHFVTVVHEASDVVSMSFIFLEDSDLTSSISHAMEDDEHDSTDMMYRTSDPCLVALDPPNLCNILAFSLSL